MLPQRANVRERDTERVISMLFDSTLPLKFWQRTYADPSGCWRWVAACTAGGYGCLRIDGWRYAHRLAYEAFKGAIPHGLEIDHLCRVRSCVNPLHLEAVTPRENMKRGIGHGSETHCPRGHAYNRANTYRHGGKRYCRMCNKLRSRVLVEVK